jgi:hypothetical protein
MILKMDDDILVDFHQLLQKLRTYSEENLRKKLFGLQHFQLEINRRGKWAVDHQQLSEQETYPNFLSGKFFFKVHKVILPIFISL